jgi:hypothetical protein
MVRYSFMMLEIIPAVKDKMTVHDPTEILATNQAACRGKILPSYFCTADTDLCLRS